MYGPTGPHLCAISFHLQGKKLPGIFHLILCGYILDVWGKYMGFKALDLALSTLLYEHTKPAFWEVLLTPSIVNLQANKISIGNSQPLESLSTSY